MTDRKMVYLKTSTWKLLKIWCVKNDYALAKKLNELVLEFLEKEQKNGNL